MDVVDIRSFEEERVVDPEPGMQKRVQPPAKSLVSLQYAIKKIFE
jgi:hypothetical protein